MWISWVDDKNKLIRFWLRCGCRSGLSVGYKTFSLYWRRYALYQVPVLVGEPILNPILNIVMFLRRPQCIIVVIQFTQSALFGEPNVLFPRGHAHITCRGTDHKIRSSHFHLKSELKYHINLMENLMEKVSLQYQVGSFIRLSSCITFIGSRKIQFNGAIALRLYPPAMSVFIQATKVMIYRLNECKSMNIKGVSNA